MRFAPMDAFNDVSRSMSVAHQAMQKISEHRQAANPKNYQIWFSYVAGFNRALIKALDAAAGVSSGLTQAAMDTIHEQFFSEKAAEDAMMQLGQAMSSELNSVQALLKNASQDTAKYGTTLEGVSGQLAKHTDPALIQVIVHELVGATKQMAVRSQALEQRLQQSTDEVLKLKQNIETIRVEAMTDQLTGLPNRRSFDATLASTLEKAWKSGEPMCLIMADIDHFKNFNDTWGHQTGDQVLKLVAHSINESIREMDVSARYGGEEFAVIMPAARIDAAREIAERIRKQVEGKRVMKRSTGEDLGRIGLSLGVAVYKHGEEAADLIRRADACLYAAKHGGRNQVKIETDVDTATVMFEASKARAAKAQRAG